MKIKEGKTRSTTNIDAASMRRQIDLMMVNKIKSQSIMRETCIQLARRAKNQNDIEVELVLRRVLIEGLGPDFGALSRGTEGTLYLEELRVDSQISIPADRGHLVYAVTNSMKKNTEYSNSTFALAAIPAREYWNAEVAAGVDYDQLWSPATNFNMVSLWGTRRISAEQNLKGRFTRENDTYIFGSGATLAQTVTRNYQRPRTEDSAAGIGRRDCSFHESFHLHNGKTKVIKFRIDGDGNFKLDHDYFMVRRFNDTENTLVTDEVAFIADTFYIRCSIVI